QSWAMGDNTRVGSASTQAVTKKPLLVRLQTPRFLVETDEVVCSTIVHNDTKNAKAVTVSLEIEGGTQLALLSGESGKRTVKVEPFEQMRVDWRMKALAAGDVKLRTFAVSENASDAMELTVPIVVYGAMKTDSWAGTVRKGQTASDITLTIPAKRREEHSLLTVRVSPSLAASMIEALPYLAKYPYGCTEQTLNRFLPSVLTQRVLQRMDLDLEKIAATQNNLNAQELGDPSERREQWGDKAIFDNDKVDDMVAKGLARLIDMQNVDGGWGWFSGNGSRSSAHLTGQVLRGLLVAQSNDVAIPPDVITRSVTWMKNYQAKELQKLKNWDLEVNPRKSHCDNTDAFVFHVLTLAKQRNVEMETRLYEDRTHLSVYGKTLLAIAFHELNDGERTQMLRRNVEQFLVADEENETAYLTDDSGWWYWYGSAIESSAMYLKLLIAMDPEDINAPRIVKYLLNNRKHATYWNSTRDTALVVESFADYLNATKELNAESMVKVYLGDKLVGSVEFTKDNLFEVNNTIQIAANAVPSGEHQLRIERSGNANLYWNVYSRNFTREEEIEKAGLEVKIERRYYLLEPSQEELELAGKNGSVVEGVGDKKVRIRVDEEVALASGKLVEVELIIESKNDYEYLLIEDKKPAGLETVDSASGYFYSQGLWIYRELREKHVGLLIERMPRGKYSVRYQLRTEAPGSFTALPASIEGMYAPELVGNSRDFDLQIVD
ncbi:MAG: alpha-2-macroglobulin family protein, partial [Planctomycetota bacterium]